MHGVLFFSVEMTSTLLQPFLQVIGFSMNDYHIVLTVSGKIPDNAECTKGNCHHKSINDTLSRTIMTSLTVFLTILILFIFGGQVTRGFAFAMLVGVLVGIYSSIFVAAPILMDFGKNRPLGDAPRTTDPYATKKKVTTA